MQEGEKAMSTTTNPVTMDAMRAGAGEGQRPPLTAPGKLALGALIGFALLSLYWQVTVKEAVFPPIGIVNAAGALVAAGILAAKRRWTPVIGAVWCGLMLLVEMGPTIRYLADPGSVNNFVIHLLQLPLLVIGLAAGVVAFVQHRRTAAA
jgi:hypothetical protein